MKQFVGLGGRVFIYSHGSSLHVKRCLHILNLKQFVPNKHIVCLDNIGFDKCKKSIGAFSFVLNLLGLNPEKTVFGEDSIQNTEGAWHAGLTTAFVDWAGEHKYNPYDKFVNERYNSFVEFMEAQVNKIN